MSPDTLARSFPSAGDADITGVLWAPQNMVGDHPPVRQIDIFLKLNGYHFQINLDNRTHQPVADAIAILVVITQYFNMIANIVHFNSIRS